MIWRKLIFFFTTLMLITLKVQASRTDAFIGYAEKTIKANEKRVMISSDYGKFIIKLRPDLAPEAAKLVYDLAVEMDGSDCPKCVFYRHEPVPEGWGLNGFYGPPYALLQGSLADVAKDPVNENPKQHSVQRGDVCFIPGSREFFIATADHSEWGVSHIVFGQVEDLSADSQHPYEPYTTLTNDGITTRWLVNKFPFRIGIAPGAAAK